MEKKICAFFYFNLENISNAKEFSNLQDYIFKQIFYSLKNVNQKNVIYLHLHFFFFKNNEIHTYLEKNRYNLNDSLIEYLKINNIKVNPLNIHFSMHFSKNFFLDSLLIIKNYNKKFTKIKDDIYLSYYNLLSLFSYNITYTSYHFVFNNTNILL